MKDNISPKIHHAILARDLIDMAKEFSDNADVLEYVSSFCFSLHLIFENDPDEPIDWHMIFSVYDQKYFSIRQHGASNVNEEPVDKIRQKAVEIISQSASGNLEKS